MLSPKCRVSDLDPLQWKRLLSLLPQSKTRPRLFLIHEKGKPKRLWLEEKGELALPSLSLDNLEVAAETLLRATPEAASIRILDPSSRSLVLSRLQAEARPGEDADSLLSGIYRASHSAEGSIDNPKEAFRLLGLPLERMQRFATKMLPSSCVFVLGVFEADALWASLLAEIQDGEIVSLSSSAILDPEDVKDILGLEQHPFFLNVAANHFQRPAFGWFLERESFAAWMQAESESRQEELFQLAIMQRKAHFDFAILIDRGLTAFSPLNPGAAAVAGQDRDANPRLRVPDPSETPPSAV